MQKPYGLFTGGRSAPLRLPPLFIARPKETREDQIMKRLCMLLIPLTLLAMSGCVVAPYGYYHRGYYGPRVAVVAPAPVVVVRP